MPKSRKRIKKEIHHSAASRKRQRLNKYKKRNQEERESIESMFERMFKF